LLGGMGWAGWNNRCSQTGLQACGRSTVLPSAWTAITPSKAVSIQKRTPATSNACTHDTHCAPSASAHRNTASRTGSEPWRPSMDPTPTPRSGRVSNQFAWPRVQNKLAATSDPTIASAIVLAGAAKRELQDMAVYYLYLQQAAFKCVGGQCAGPSCGA
jgi:hypothetical protein